ncbi:MAG: HPr kinase/phosphorylase [Terriglobia bacterium]
MRSLRAQTSRQQEPNTPFCEWYLVADASCAVATNSKDILASARRCLRRSIPPRPVPDLRMFLWVDPNAPGGTPWPQPHFRGLSHLIYAGLDSQCALLLDLRHCRVIGRFSPAMAQDAEYLQRVVFPNAIGLMSEALGLTTLHCACVERGSAGLLLSGASGAGKSTLALALARNGFAFLSDDWTYFSGAGAQLRAWGLASTVKLLPDAVRYFPELGRLKPTISTNGELAYEVDPEPVFGVDHALACEPRWRVFLERRDPAGYSLTRMAPHEAAARLEVDLEDLPVELSAVREAQSRIIQELAARECWLLCHGESPAEMAGALARLCSSPERPAPGSASMAEVRNKSVRAGPDIIRRFAPTPLVAEFAVMDRTIRLETNSPAILQQVREAVGVQSTSAMAPQHFLWRLVSDADAESHLPWPAPSGFSADGLHLENVGQHNFFAVDADARIAVGFVAEELLNDSAFQKFLVARLVSTTYAAFEAPS